MGSDPQNAGFTGASQSFNAASMESMFSSLNSEFSQTAGPFNGFGASTTPTSSGSQTTSTGASRSGGSGTTLASSTFSTSVSPAPGASNPAESLSGHATNTASNAASSITDGPVTVSEKLSCNSLSCSSALKAAIAVPIVVAAIVAIFLFFFCARRRRRRAGSVISEKRPPRTGKQKWTAHLRAFSFDAEMLMGGRFSGSNSLRSQDPSLRSGTGASSRDAASSAAPSLHSIEEVAPPYRDAISHVPPPSQLRSAPGLASILTDPIPRPSSTATAPPPYRSIVHGASPEPASPTSVRNPFSDSLPVSPIDESPFNDPPGATLAPASSRGSSLYRSDMTDDTATLAASDAGSVREAMVGRRVSARNNGSTRGGS